MPAQLKLRFLNEKTGEREIRRRNVEYLDYDDLCQEIRYMFPGLHGESFTMSWKDCDGDDIIISSKEELRIARTDNMGGVINLYITVRNKRRTQLPDEFNQQETLHYRVYCDGCENQIRGFRYKCLQCDDYDLCSSCEALGVHPEHYMIRSSKSLTSRCIKEYWEKNCKSLLNMFGPHFNEFLSFLDPCLLKKFSEKPTEKKTADSSGPSSKGPKQENNKDDRDNVQTNEDAKKEERQERPQSTQDKTVDSSSSKGTGTPGEKNDDKVSMSDASSSTSIDMSNAIDGWKLVDIKEATNLTHASSAASSLNDAAAKEGKQSVSEETTPRGSLYPKLPEEERTYHPDPNIQKALDAMISMGFSNQGGLLTYLLVTEKGNISKVLDFLQPIQD